MQATKTVYEVICTFRGGSVVVGTYSTLKRARNAVDKKDLAIGGYYHRIQACQVTEGAPVVR